MFGWLLKVTVQKNTEICRHLALSHATKINGMTSVLTGIIILVRHSLECSAEPQPEYPTLLHRQSLAHLRNALCSASQIPDCCIANFSSFRYSHSINYCPHKRCADSGVEVVALQQRQSAGRACLFFFVCVQVFVMFSASRFLRLQHSVSGTICCRTRNLGVCRKNPANI